MIRDDRPDTSSADHRPAASTREDDSSLAQQNSPSRRRPGPIRRLARCCVWMSALLTLLLTLLPTLVSQTSLRQSLIPLLRPDLPVTPRIGSANLGWFLPVVLEDLEIPDLEGRPLLFVQRVQTGRPLWELLVNPGDPGRLALTGLKLDLVVRPGGHNLGDVLHRMRRDPDSRTLRRVRIDWTAASIHCRTTRGDVVSELVDVAGFFDLTGGTAVPHRLLVQGTAGPDYPRGRLALAGEWLPPRPGSPLPGPGELALELVDWPLDGWQPVAGPWLEATALAGETTAVVQVRWEDLTADGGQAIIHGELQKFNVVWQPAGEDAEPRGLRLDGSHLTLQGEYLAAGDRLRLYDSQFAVAGLQAEIAGAINDLRGDCRLDLQAEAVCDLQPWLDRLDPGVREQLRVEGLQTKRVALCGPLRKPAEALGPQDEAASVAAAIAPPPDRLTIAADVIWTQVAAYGISSENGRIEFDFDGATLRAVPVEVPVSGGRLVALPDIHFAAGAPVLRFRAMPLLERVSFSEELCRGWMRFLSPAMANATSVTGSFSLGCAAGEFPLGTVPREGLAGALAIHEARVGPGPLTRQVLDVVQQVQGVTLRRQSSPTREDLRFLTISEQLVPFELREGRMYHGDLLMHAGPVEIRSAGSVGVEDETLDLQLTIRFPESWFANRPLLAGLQGEGLTIPIKGTLSQPQIDGRPLAEFGRGIGLRATGNLLKRLLDR